MFKRILPLLVVLFFSCSRSRKGELKDINTLKNMEILGADLNANIKQVYTNVDLYMTEGRIPRLINLNTQKGYIFKTYKSGSFNTRYSIIDSLSNISYEIYKTNIPAPIVFDGNEKCFYISTEFNVATVAVDVDTVIFKKYIIP